MHARHNTHVTVTISFLIDRLFLHQRQEDVSWMMYCLMTPRSSLKPLWYINNNQRGAHCFMAVASCKDCALRADTSQHAPPDHVNPAPLRYLLVATDSPILLVLRLSDWGMVRRLYGLDVDKFHNASVAWHWGSSYIMAGADCLLFFHVLGSPPALSPF